jgi:tetratricopeptide (TPR) repeat protein
MSVAPVVCQDCRCEGVFDGLGPFPPNQEASFGVAWKCPRCGKRSLDVCNLGPLVPTADCCLNCGARYEAGQTGCPACGLEPAQATAFLRLDLQGQDPLEAAREAFNHRLYRRGLALCNLLLQRDPGALAAWDAKLSFLDVLRFRNARREMLRQALERGAPPQLLIPYGGQLNAEGRHAEAAAAFRDYLDRCPDSPQAAAVLSTLGNALTALGDFAAAEQAHERALALGPGSSPLYLNYADTLRRQRKWDDALAATERGLNVARTDADKIDLLDLKASVLLGQMRGAEGLACCEEAMALGSDLARTHYLHGRALALLGRLPEALAAMQQVLRVDPSNADAQKAIAQIQQALDH